MRSFWVTIGCTFAGIGVGLVTWAIAALSGTPELLVLVGGVLIMIAGFYMALAAQFGCWPLASLGESAEEPDRLNGLRPFKRTIVHQEDNVQTVRHQEYIDRKDVHVEITDAIAATSSVASFPSEGGEEDEPDTEVDA